MHAGAQPPSPPASLTRERAYHRIADSFRGSRGATRAPSISSSDDYSYDSSETSSCCASDCWCGSSESSSQSHCSSSDEDGAYERGRLMRIANRYYFYTLLRGYRSAPDVCMGAEFSFHEEPAREAAEEAEPGCYDLLHADQKSPSSPIARNEDALSDSDGASAQDFFG